jgi:hypothetical protein
MTAMPMDLRTALDRAGSLGAFSAVTARPGPDWLTVGQFLREPGALRARIEATRVALSRSEPDASRAGLRVAASVMEQGLAARLASPALATAVLAGWTPELDPERVWWQPDRSHPIPLAIPDPTGRFGADPDSIAAAFHELVVEPLLRPLVDAVGDAVSLSRAVLWGNVWSGLAGGLAPIGAARRDLLPRARGIVSAILEVEGSLDDSRERHVGGFVATGRYMRTTCCLLYRLPPNGLCGDCVLR